MSETPTRVARGLALAVDAAPVLVLVVRNGADAARSFEPAPVPYDASVAAALVRMSPMLMRSFATEAALRPCERAALFAAVAIGTTLYAALGGWYGAETLVRAFSSEPRVADLFAQARIVRSVSEAATFAGFALAFRCLASVDAGALDAGRGERVARTFE